MIILRRVKPKEKTAGSRSWGRLFRKGKENTASGKMKWLTSEKRYYAAGGSPHASPAKNKAYKKVLDRQHKISIKKRKPVDIYVEPPG